MNILTLIILILLVGWALGVFVFNATGLIYILLAIAAVLLILRVIRGDRL